ncbi:Uncharacterised protein [uncultured archaeon]|nr:Uncharacterised protein [uncultured archaeon]
MAENDFNDLEEIVNKLVKELFDTDAFKDLNPSDQVVYDVSIKLKQKPLNKSKLKVFEPLVDVIDEKTGYRILFEIPGFDEEKLNLKVSPLNLNLKVKGSNSFSKTIDFKNPVIVDSVKTKYNNGIFEVFVLKEVKKKVSLKN